MIDFHSHILPNVDDGSKSVEETFELLKEAKEAGFDANFLWHYNFAVNAFFAYRLPIFPKVSFQADFSYINFNGFSVKIDSFSYCYSYKSIELAPLAKFCDSFRIVNYSLFAGPNFSFPIGKI